MARHIVAVCVVCLLCADRLPCQQHFDDIVLAKSDRSNDFLHNGGAKNAFLQSTNTEYGPDGRESEISAIGKQYGAVHRRKRHAGHVHHDHLRPEVTEEFLQRLFNEYGFHGRIGMLSFRRMLSQLGLQQLVSQNLSEPVNIASTCIDDTTLIRHVQPHTLHGARPANVVDCSANSTKCAHLSVDSRASPSINYSLNVDDMLNLCPILLHQMVSPGCIESSTLAEIDSHELGHMASAKEDIVYVWIYAFISVFACGILGLVGVAIIPFMETRYYKHIIQFLVALAVGTMTGDALLHLLPHSLAGQTEQNMIYKGLTCMSGIIFFYVTEHGLTMISEWRKRIVKKETKKPSGAKVMRDPDSALNSSVPGGKLCKSKYSSYPYCYDEIAMDTKNDVWLHLPNNTEDIHNMCSNTERKRNGKIEVDAGGAAAQSLLSTSQNNYAPIAELNHHQSNSNNHHVGVQQKALPDSNTISTDLDSVNDGNMLGSAVNGNNSTANNKALGSDAVTVILREHESSHHGHSHKHGHVHSPPDSLSSVAWMIIMGDGLHNFTDGMAIGAAFAENIAGGFSTSFAVFCHELPHELGDFAILIKAGMSVRSAVYYNLLTGVLSFIGMIFGIVFGQSQEAAQWMFAAAAGLFIYIALVDMLPELSAAHNSLTQLSLQVLGMSSGVFIMFLIAIYEGDLMSIFSSSSSNEHHHVH